MTMQVLLSDALWFGVAFVGLFLGSLIVNVLFRARRR